MEKILKIVFILLLIVTISEAGFYIYILTISKYARPEKSAQVLIPSITESQNEISNNEYLINSDSLEYLKNMKKVQNKSVLISINEIGKISIARKQPINSGYELVLVDDKEVLVSAAARTLDDWNDILFKKTQNGEEKIVFTDLKEGDTISHNFQIDLVQNNQTHKYLLISE